MPGTPQPRADAGAERSAAIECKMLRGSTVVRSTPSRALRDSSAREGRPLFRFGFPGVAGGSSTICLALKFNHRGFLAFSSARVVSPSHRARVKRGLDPNILLPPPAISTGCSGFLASPSSLHPHAVVLDNERPLLVEHAPTRL